MLFLVPVVGPILGVFEAIIGMELLTVPFLVPVFQAAGVFLIALAF